MIKYPLSGRDVLLRDVKHRVSGCATSLNKFELLSDVPFSGRDVLLGGVKSRANGCATSLNKLHTL